MPPAYVRLLLLAAWACGSSPAATGGGGGGASAPTREELTAALAAAFGSAGMTVSALSGVPMVDGGTFASGRKYDLAIDWERPVSAWTQRELRGARERGQGKRPRAAGAAAG